MGGRTRAVQHRLARRVDTPVERLALQWFRRCFEASRNSGSAATLYMFLSVGPLLLAATGLFHAVGWDTNTFVQRLIAHDPLTGETARVVSDCQERWRVSRRPRLAGCLHGLLALDAALSPAQADQPAAAPTGRSATAWLRAAQAAAISHIKPLVVPGRRPELPPTPNSGPRYNW